MYRQTSLSDKVAAFVLRQEGWTVIEVVGKFHRLELIKPGKRVAVAIFDQRRRVQLNQIERFSNFLNSAEGAIFSGGIAITTTGFSRSVYTFLESIPDQKIRIAQIKGTEFTYDPEPMDDSNGLTKPLYIGVFTSKGGVGKTTVSAHLAGAFAANGYDVALVDLDEQKNLQKLLNGGVWVSFSERNEALFIPVYGREDWKEGLHQDRRIVICDCSPDFETNPIEFVKRFDYCIIPTTLNPLGINKNGAVIKQTLEKIRNVNIDARLFVLINALQSDEVKRNRLLSAYFRKNFEEMMSDDQLCQYIDPEIVAIRFSKQLLYWGFHLFENSRPELAFGRIGQYSNPRNDFLKLVDFLEETTEIARSKRVGSGIPPKVYS